MKKFYDWLGKNWYQVLWYTTLIALTPREFYNAYVYHLHITKLITSSIAPIAINAIILIAAIYLPRLPFYRPLVPPKTIVQCCIMTYVAMGAEIFVYIFLMRLPW